VIVYRQLLIYRWLAASLIVSVTCLFLAPHVPVTREAHCGLRITMHMMEASWTLTFAAAAIAGVSALMLGWPHLTIAIGVAAGGYAIYLMSQIRSWYSYESVPDELDLMGRVFGHVLGFGLPMALAGSVLLVVASIAYPDHNDVYSH